MTSRVKIIHDGGNKALAVLDQKGTQVAVLEKQGDEFSDTVYDGQTFRVEETGAFLDTAAPQEANEEGG